jgi:dihydroxy-acid dehydratase
MIAIDIPNRGIQLQLSDAEIAARREAQEARGDKAWTPKDRERQVSFALRAYASLATSADKGAVRDKSKLGANDGGFTTLSAAPEGRNISERCCARRSMKRCRKRRCKKWKNSLRASITLFW